jgi:hypothetical protein
MCMGLRLSANAAIAFTLEVGLIFLFAYMV